MISRKNCYNKYAGRNLRLQVNGIMVLMGLLIVVDIYVLMVLGDRMENMGMFILELGTLMVSAIGLYFSKHWACLLLFLVEQFIAMVTLESKSGVLLIILLIAIIRELIRFEKEIKYYQQMNEQELPEPIGIHESINATTVITLIVVVGNCAMVIRSIVLMIS